MIRNYNIVYISIVAIAIMILSACDRGNSGVAVVMDVQTSPSGAESERVSSIEIPQTGTGDERYIFDVNDHTIEELHSLLNRADEINVKEREKYEGLDIVLILHGPDINRFTYENYQQNKTIMDLAARLDAFGIIDMKICETSMSELGISRDNLPPFIEPVPYARKTIEEFTDRGYIKL